MVGMVNDGMKVSLGRGERVGEVGLGLGSCIVGRGVELDN